MRHSPFSPLLLSRVCVRAMKSGVVSQREKEKEKERMLRQKVGLDVK